MKKAGIISLFLIFLSFDIYSQEAEEVIFSASGGFYNNVFQLQLISANPDNHIRYTINGSSPTAESPLYTEPLLLDEQLYSTSDIYTLLNCPPNHYFQPESVKHCIVIRAAVFDDNGICLSEVVTNSYFINELGCDTHGLPVVSLCADSLDLFDYNTGILIPGVHYNPNNPYLTGNYFMKGREWERIINFEFYETDNVGINQTVGLRTHGNQQRWKSQKGMKVYAREEYGVKRFYHKFFETIPNESFKHLLLRPFQSSWLGAGCNDYICGRIAEPLDFESLASRPAVLFLNGEYWGVYFVSERPDERFLHDHLGVNIDSVNIMYGWHGEVDCGSSDDFIAFYNWMQQADLTQPDQYAYVESKIDMNNFIDYYIFEMFIGNRDWSNNNVRIWQVVNGLFRWFFYDGDSCFIYSDFDVFANAVYVGTNQFPSSTSSTLFFRRLYENYGFKRRFRARFEELVETNFAYVNTKPFYDSIKAELSGEVQNQIDRFGQPPETYSSWQTYNIYMINRFLRNRPTYILDQLYDFLSVDETQSDNITIYPNPATDVIKINEDAVGCDIYDMLGKQVLSISTNMEEIRITDLPPGIYVVRIFTRNGNVVTKKLCKGE